MEPAIDLAGRRGTPDEVGAVVPHPAELGLLLDAFDDRADAHAATDLEKLGGDQPLDRIEVNPADQLAVELDEVGSHAVNQVESGPACTKVVERDPEARLAIAAEHPVELFDVSETIGLDHLEDHPVMGKVRLLDGRERRFQVRARVADGSGREVDEDRHLGPVASGLADGGPAGGKVDLEEHPCLTREIEDGLRRDQAAVALDATQERLVRKHPARVTGVHNGMKVARKASLGQLIEEPSRTGKNIERVQRRHAGKIRKLRCGGPEHEQRLGCLGVGGRKRFDEVGDAALDVGVRERNARAGVGQEIPPPMLAQVTYDAGNATFAQPEEQRP